MGIGSGVPCSSSQPRGVTSLSVWLSAMVVSAVGACGPNVSGRDDPFPMVEFDPAAQIIPMPNNMLLEEPPDLPGALRINIPWQCAEVPLARDLREEGLNGLDGFSTYKPSLRATFTHEVDEDSLLGRVYFTCRSPTQTDLIACEPNGDYCNLKMAELVRPEPTDCLGRTTVYQLTAMPEDVFWADPDPGVPGQGDKRVDAIPEHSTCGLAILDGVLTTDGEPFQPSPTWYLTRQAGSPVALDGNNVVRNRTPLDSTDIDTLREFHEEVWQPYQDLLDMFAAAGHPRSTILLAWEFTTQTILEPLDINVAGTPAAITYGTDAGVAISEIIRHQDPSSPNNLDPIGVNFDEENTGLKSGGEQASMSHPCNHVDCGAIGAIVNGFFTSPRFLQERDNPGDLSEYPATDQWNDPYRPEPFDAQARVEFRAWFPNPDRWPTPLCGYPMVVLGCGLSAVKEGWYSTTTVLAAAGIASISIDSVNQGTRAVQISDSAEGDCDDVEGGEDYTGNQTCFEHIIPTKLAAGRDNVRQTALDTIALSRMVSEDGIRQACTNSGATGCDDLKVDGGRVGYEGLSMGAVIGTIISAMSPDIKASVLTAGGADWIDLFLDGGGYMRCPMVDGLITAGILDPGDLANGGYWDDGRNSDALCLQDDWEDSPAFLQIAEVARWILAPGDPSNFARRLGDKVDAAQIRLLLQQMHAENAVSNATTSNLADIIGFDDPEESGLSPSIYSRQPSPAICTAAAADDAQLDGQQNSLFLDYVSNTGNTTRTSSFIHQSIAQFPTADDPAGRGAVQVQHDMAVFLCESLERAPMPAANRLRCDASDWESSYDCNAFLNAAYPSAPAVACPQ